MKLLEKFCRSITFKSDGTYNLGWYALSHLIYTTTNEEIEQLKKNLTKISSSVVDGDILYFTKKAPFPKLLLSKLTTDVSRTIKEEKSTKIVVDGYHIPKSYELNDERTGYVVELTLRSGRTENYFISNRDIKQCQEWGYNLEYLHNRLCGAWTAAVYFADVTSEDALNYIISAPEKVVSVTDVTKYLNSKLATLDKDSAETMIRLFASTPENKDLGLSMLITFNVSNVLFDVIWSYCSSSDDFSDSTRNSVNFKYFKALTGINLRRAKKYWKRGLYRNEDSAKLYHSPLLSESQKEKAWNVFWCEVTNHKKYDPDYVMTDYDIRRFKTYNMPLTYDKN